MVAKEEKVISICISHLISGIIPNGLQIQVLPIFEIGLFFYILQLLSEKSTGDKSSYTKELTCQEKLYHEKEKVYL